MTSDYRDDELVRLTLAGDSEAFAPLVRRHRRAALARALSIGLDPLDADSVAQGAFVHAYEQLAALRDPARFEPWLMAIVHRRARDFARAEKRRRAEPRAELGALDLDADPLAPGRFERSVVSRIAALNTSPVVPMDPLFGLWSLSRPLLLAAAIVALALLAVSLRERPRAQVAPETIAEAMGVPPQLLSTGPRK